MPVTVEQALARATPIVLGTLTHPDYARTVEYAADCHDMETGNIGRFLERFTARETLEEFEARKRLTVSTLPAVWSELRNPFFKVSRLKGAQVERRFEYADEPSEAELARRVSALTAAVDKYHASKPVEDYLSDTVIRSWALSDPNAWLLTEFRPFDFRTERARPFPVIIPAENAVDFTREAGDVTSFTARVAVEAGGAKGYRYTVYLDNQSLDFWPVLHLNSATFPTMPEGSIVAGVLANEQNAVVYQYRLLTHRAGKVPALPLGYVPDAVTKGRTWASPLDSALCFLLKEIKTGSELDIVMARTVHPHKSQYVPACTGYAQDGGCRDGIAPRLNGGDPGTCRMCQGTKVSPISVSATDVNTFPLPKTLEDMAKLPKLGDMVDFKTPPIEVPEFQIKYLDWLHVLAHRTLFNTELLTKVQVATTATERRMSADQMNIALSPMADFLSALYVGIATICAAYVDVAGGLSVSYLYPADLIPPLLEDLMAEYQSAVTAGAGPEFLEMLYKRMVSQQLAENPEELRRLKVKWRFVSYVGVPEPWVMQRAALGYISTESRTLRIEQDRVFYELEQANPGFYNLAPKAQQPLVDAKVKELVALLPGASATGMARMSFGTSPAPAVPAVA
jgi:hypothetical protein